MNNESLIEKLQSIMPKADAPELSEIAYRQAVIDCIDIIKKYSSACQDTLAGASDSSGGERYPNEHPCSGEFESPAAANSSEISLKSELVKIVRGAIYNTWYRQGIADVDMVASIAVGSLGPYLRTTEPVFKPHG